MAGYNLTREVEDLLERIEPLPPSFTVHLHPDYWTLNSGSKLLYNNQVAVSGMCIAMAPSY
jgi:transcription factor SPT20